MELAASNQSLISFGVPTMAHHLLKEEIKDTRGVIRIHKSKNDSVGSLIKAAAVMRKSKPACSKMNNDKETLHAKNLYMVDLSINLSDTAFISTIYWLLSSSIASKNQFGVLFYTV
jgi:hypothetical protein